MPSITELQAMLSNLGGESACSFAYVNEVNEGTGQQMQYVLEEFDPRWPPNGATYIHCHTYVHVEPWAE